MAADCASLPSPSIEILQSWGVASARISSGCPVQPLDSPSGSTAEHLYDVPLGPLVVRWDLLSHKRVLQFQAHSDLVMCARRSPDGSLIASSAYSGGVKLWSPQWVCQDSTQAPMQSQFHVSQLIFTITYLVLLKGNKLQCAIENLLPSNTQHSNPMNYGLLVTQLAWSPNGKRFLVLGNGKHSSIVVYEAYEEDSVFKLKRVWHLLAKGLPSPPDLGTSGEDCRVQDQEPSDPSHSEAMASSSKESGLNYRYEEAFFMAEFNPSGRIFAVKEMPYITTLLYLISPDGCVDKVADLMALIGQKDCSRRPQNTIFMTGHHDGLYAVGVEGGYIALVDAELLQLNRVFKVVSGCHEH